MGWILVYAYSVVVLKVYVSITDSD